MGQPVVVVGKPVRVDQAVEERRVRAADDVVVALVLQIHHVHVIELADRRYRRSRFRGRGQVSADRERQVVGVGVVVARAGAEDPGIVIPKVERDLRVLGAHREGSGGCPFPEAGLQPAVQGGDRTNAGAAEIGLIGIEEIDLHGRGRGVEYETSKIPAQIESHCPQVDLILRGAEIDGLSQRRTGHVAAAEELITRVRRSALRTRETQERRKVRHREAQADRPEIAQRAVLDHRRRARQRPTRDADRAESGQRWVTDLGTRVRQQIRAHGEGLCRRYRRGCRA